MWNKEKAIKDIFSRHEKKSIYITSTGYISRTIYHFYPNKKNIFYIRGSMGLSPSIGLGIALNSKKNIIVISGDGALLMHLGIIHTIRDYSLSNLFLYILDNNSYESVGGQKCSDLEKKYIGVNKIYKVKKNKKYSRVSINWIENKKT